MLREWRTVREEKKGESKGMICEGERERERNERGVGAEEEFIVQSEGLSPPFFLSLENCTLRFKKGKEACVRVVKVSDKSC